MQTNCLKFQAITQSDLEQIHQWYHTPEVNKWYGESKAWTLAQIQEHYKPYLSSSSDVKGFIVYHEDRAIGYIQYYCISQDNLPENVNLEQLNELGIKSQSTVGMDGFLSDENINQGLGPFVFAEFILKVIPKKYSHIVCDPSRENKRSISAFQKTGFQVILDNLQKSTILMQVLRKSVKTLISTDRLWLREACALDIPKIVNFVKQNRKFHQEFEPIRDNEYYTQEYWQKLIPEREQYSFDQRGLQLFLYAKQNSNEILGNINVFNIVRGGFYACTIGYGLAENAQGQGYMTEALKAVCHHLFITQKLHRIQANYMTKNTRSGHVLQRCGFIQEGQAKDYLNINGQWKDHILTSLVNTDWQLVDKI